MTTEEEILIKMKNFFENIDKLKINLEQEIKTTELKRDDLLHELELGNLNAIELTKVAVALKNILKERRQYKDELAKVMTLKGFTDKYNNKLIAGDIIQNLKEQGILRKKQENPTYKYRTNILDRLETKDE